MQLLIAEKFDVLITVDKNLSYQQNFLRFPIAVLVLNADGIDYVSLTPLIPKILEALSTPLKPGALEINL